MECLCEHWDCLQTMSILAFLSVLFCLSCSGSVSVQAKEHRNVASFDIRSKFDGFIVHNKEENPYLLMRTQAGLHFLIDGKKGSCYHPKAYRVPTAKKDFHYGIDSLRNALFVFTADHFLYQYNLELGRYNTLMGELLDKGVLEGKVNWDIVYLHYSDKYIGHFALFNYGWIMMWDHVQDYLSWDNRPPETFTPVLHSPQYINASAFHVTSFIGRADVALVPNQTHIHYSNILRNTDQEMVIALDEGCTFQAMDSNQIGDVFFGFMCTIENNITGTSSSKLSLKHYRAESGENSLQVLTEAPDIWGSESKNQSQKLERYRKIVSMSASNELLVIAFQDVNYNYDIIVYHPKSDFEVFQEVHCPFVSYDYFETKRQFPFAIEQIMLIDPHRQYNYEETKWKKNQRQERRNIDFVEPNEVSSELWLKPIIMMFVSAFIIASLLWNPNLRNLT